MGIGDGRPGPGQVGVDRFGGYPNIHRRRDRGIDGPDLAQAEGTERRNLPVSGKNPKYEAVGLQDLGVVRPEEGIRPPDADYGPQAGGLGRPVEPELSRRVDPPAPAEDLVLDDERFRPARLDVNRKVVITEGRPARIAVNGLSRPQVALAAQDGGQDPGPNDQKNGQDQQNRADGSPAQSTSQARPMRSTSIATQRPSRYQLEYR